MFRLKPSPGEDIYADIYLVDRAKLAQCNIRDVSERKRTEKDLQSGAGKSLRKRIQVGGHHGLNGGRTHYPGYQLHIIYQNKVLKDFRGDHIGEHCYTAYEHLDHICEGCPVEMAYKDGGIHKAERSVTTGDGHAVRRDNRISFTGPARECRGRDRDRKGHQ